MKKTEVPKKVNRHVLKALVFLQASRPSFVSIEAITDRVRRSLRYTKPVPNLKYAVRGSLRNQNKLGIVARNGSSYAMNLALKRLRSTRDVNRTQKTQNRLRNCDSLTLGEIAKVRTMLRGIQKTTVKRKQYAPVAPKAITKSKPKMQIQPTKERDSH